MITQIKRNIILPLIVLIGVPIAITAATHESKSNDDKIYIIKNNSTRDYKYEYYCDSLYYIDKDYYLDVVVESDKFQSYIEEHGEWWTN